MILNAKKARYQPYGDARCKVCHKQLHQGGKYCQKCAYKKGMYLVVGNDN